MKVALEGKIRRAEEIAGAFAEFKRQVALSSRFGRSGRPLSEAALAQLEARELVAEEAVQRARLKNVHLANRCGRDFVGLAALPTRAERRQHH
jgi:hypothetical protein